MDIQIATLCDFAADYNGKMVISGTFDTLVVRSFPASHPKCALAMRMCLTDDDNGAHTLAVSVIDQDGTPIDQRMPIKAEMPVQIADNVPFITRNVVVDLHGIRFEKPGVYSVDVIVDDELVARIPLRVLKVKEESQPMA